MHQSLGSRFFLVVCFALAGLAGEAFGETRDQFREKVRNGMNQDQVVAAVGRPNKAEDTYGGVGTDYYYNNRTEDPATGKKDRSAIVSFYNGVVIGIRFDR